MPGRRTVTDLMRGNLRRVTTQPFPRIEQMGYFFPGERPISVISVPYAAYITARREDRRLSFTQLYALFSYYAGVEIVRNRAEGREHSVRFQSFSNLSVQEFAFIEQASGLLLQTPFVSPYSLPVEIPNSLYGDREEDGPAVRAIRSYLSSHPQWYTQDPDYTHFSSFLNEYFNVSIPHENYLSLIRGAEAGRRDPLDSPCRYSTIFLTDSIEVGNRREGLRHESILSSTNVYTVSPSFTRFPDHIVQMLSNVLELSSEVYVSGFFHRAMGDEIQDYFNLEDPAGHISSVYYRDQAFQHMEPWRRYPATQDRPFFTVLLREFQIDRTVSQGQERITHVILAREGGGNFRLPIEQFLWFFRVITFDSHEIYHEIVENPHMLLFRGISCDEEGCLELTRGAPRDLY